MKLLPEEIALINLEQGFLKESPHFRPREQALEELRQLTGQDFGEDVQAWEDWLARRSAEMLGAADMNGSTTETLDERVHKVLDETKQHLGKSKYRRFSSSY